MASTTTVTVVVVTYDSAPLLPGLVSALSDGLADVGHELVFVDNASADDTCDVVRRLAPTATLVALDRNKGYAAGINAGIAAASPDADAVIVMNPDVRPSRRCVEHLLGALGHDGVGIAVPRLLDADGHLSCSLRRRPTVGRAFGEALLGGTRAGRHPLLGEVVTDVAAYEEPTTADWATGAIMAISQGCLAAVGAWNEDFFLYSEETEFCAPSVRPRVRDAAGARGGGTAHRRRDGDLAPGCGRCRCAIACGSTSAGTGGPPRRSSASASGSTRPSGRLAAATSTAPGSSRCWRRRVARWRWRIRSSHRSRAR